MEAAVLHNGRTCGGVLVGLPVRYGGCANQREWEVM